MLLCSDGAQSVATGAHDGNGLLVAISAPGSV